MQGRMTLRLVHPDTASPIVWDSPYALATQALFVDHGAVYLLVAPGVGTTHEAAGCPYPLTMLFRHTGQGWVQMPLEAIPVREIEANMVLDPKASIVSIKGAKYRLDASATKGAAGWTARFYPIADPSKVGHQVFRCPEKRRPLVR